MLVLARGKGEVIEIDGGRIKVSVASINVGVVKLGIDAPADVPIHRAEVAQRIREQQAEAKERPQHAAVPMTNDELSEWKATPILWLADCKKNGLYRFICEHFNGDRDFVLFRFRTNGDPLCPTITESWVNSVNDRVPDPHERLAWEAVWESSVKSIAENLIAQEMAAEKAGQA
jgi:carbon storage regulator